MNHSYSSDQECHCPDCDRRQREIALGLRILRPREASIHAVLFWVSMVLLGAGTMALVHGDRGGVMFAAGLVVLWIARRVR